jgi:predicted transposase/invertase (TIGR01784 family)
MYPGSRQCTPPLHVLRIQREHGNFTPVQAVFADPKTDFVFKRIFGSESRKPLLTALLNNLLELEGSEAIATVEHLPNEQHLESASLKLSIVDVKCTDVSGRKFVVEMQVLKIEGFEKRVVYNASKAYVMQLRNAEDYPKLCDVVGVTICNFTLWDELNADGSYLVPMLSRWRMQEQHSGAKGRSQLQHVFLELPKYAGGDAPDSLVDRWAYFFGEAKNLDVVPPALAQGPVREALEVARSVNFSVDEWQAYERAKMAEQDARGALSVAHREGKAEGIAEGEARGEARGAAKGEARGKAEAVRMILEARSLLISAEQRVRILQCEDVATLATWVKRAVLVGAVGELWA